MITHPAASRNACLGAAGPQRQAARATLCTLSWRPGPSCVLSLPPAVSGPCRCPCGRTDLGLSPAGVQDGCQEMAWGPGAWALQTGRRRALPLWVSVGEGFLAVGLQGGCSSAEGAQAE